MRGLIKDVDIIKIKKPFVLIDYCVFYQLTIVKVLIRTPYI